MNPARTLPRILMPLGWPGQDACLIKAMYALRKSRWVGPQRSHSTSLADTGANSRPFSSLPRSPTFHGCLSWTSTDSPSAGVDSPWREVYLLPPLFSGWVATFLVTKRNWSLAVLPRHVRQWGKSPRDVQRPSVTLSLDVMSWVSGTQKSLWPNFYKWTWLTIKPHVCS